VQRFARNESGEATTEVVLVTPVLLLMITIILNFALWYHASSIARAASQEGARSARLVGGTQDSGYQETDRFLSQLGSKVLVAPVITVQRDDVETRVEIRGYAADVVPGLKLPVHAIAAAPTEAFRAP
jgi:Flp pilus assembly protein TadG